MVKLVSFQVRLVAILACCSAGSVATTHAGAQQFGFQGQLPPNDNWLNGVILSGDADHDGRREFVIIRNPDGGAAGQVAAFFEEDGTGTYDTAFELAVCDSTGFLGAGLLAMGDFDGDGLTDLFIQRFVPGCRPNQCYEYVRYEAASANAFPSVLAWSYLQAGWGRDPRGILHDSDSDGSVEFIVSDWGPNCSTCPGTKLLVFEARPGDVVELVYSYQLPYSAIGSPVAADFNGDGRQEIVGAFGLGLELWVFKSVGDNQWIVQGMVPTGLVNAYQLALIDQGSPNGRPMVFQTGTSGGNATKINIYQAPPNGLLAKIGETVIPSSCGASLTPIQAVDLVGTLTPEIVVTGPCSNILFYSPLRNGGLMLLDQIGFSPTFEFGAYPRSGARPGRLAVTTALNSTTTGNTFLVGVNNQ